MTKSGTLEESSGALEAEPQLDPSELRGQVSLHLPVHWFVTQVFYVSSDQSLLLLLQP